MASSREIASLIASLSTKRGASRSAGLFQAEMGWAEGSRTGRPSGAGQESRIGSAPVPAAKSDERSSPARTAQPSSSLVPAILP
jgi:hypothetical protein